MSPVNWAASSKTFNNVNLKLEWWCLFSNVKSSWCFFLNYTFVIYIIFKKVLQFFFIQVIWVPEILFSETENWKLTEDINLSAILFSFCTDVRSEISKYHLPAQLLVTCRCSTYPPICFFSLAQSSRSVKRKTWRSFLAPSTNSTMKLSFSSCRFYGNNR